MWLSVVLVRTTFRNSKGKVIPVVEAAEGLRWFFTRAYSHPGRKGLPQMDAGGADRVNRSRSLTRSSFSVFFPNSNPRTQPQPDPFWLLVRRRGGVRRASPQMPDFWPR